MDSPPRNRANSWGYFAQVILGLLVAAFFLAGRQVEGRIRDQADAEVRYRLAIEETTALRRDTRKAYVAFLEMSPGRLGTTDDTVRAVARASAEVAREVVAFSDCATCDSAELGERVGLAHEVERWLARLAVEAPGPGGIARLKDSISDVDQLAEAIVARDSAAAKEADAETAVLRARQGDLRSVAQALLLTLVASLVITRIRTAARARLATAEHTRREQVELNQVLEGRVAERTGELQKANAALVAEMEARSGLEVELRQAQKLESIGRLAAGVAHEINNPMAFVLANLTFVADRLRHAAPELLAAQSDLIGAVDDSLAGCGRVQVIVQDLKMLSRVDTAALAPIDAATAIDLSIKMVEARLLSRGRLIKNYGPAPQVRASEARLGQVVLNLLVNAIDAIPEGHPLDHEIEVSTRTGRAGEAVIEIRDTGSGIPPAVRERIFDPFFTTKPVGSGTGLGLALSHGIITGLGGTLSVQSELGRGTTFRIALPGVAVVAATPVAGKELRPLASSRKRVLIVDDEPLLATSLKRILRNEHEVEIALGGEEALRLLQAHEPFDVILCDLMMPGMTGMALFEEIRRIGPELASRVVILTGGILTPAIQNFFSKTGTPVVEKPISGAALSALIRGGAPAVVSASG